MSAGREVLLPFCQVVRAPAAASLDIALSGTTIGGATKTEHGLFCNYISVEPIKSSDGGESAPANGYYQVVPTGMKPYRGGYVNSGNNPSAMTVSGISGSRYDADEEQDVTSVGDFSGSPAGAGAGVLGGPTTLTSLSLNGPTMTSSITIHTHFDASCLMLVNYGVVQKSNHMRDADNYIGS